jgi:hypothetical protein
VREIGRILGAGDVPGTRLEDDSGRETVGSNDHRPR